MLLRDQSISAVPIPPTPGNSGAFFLIVHPRGQAFDGLVTFTSQHCHFLQ